MTQELWSGGPVFIDDPGCFRIGTDSVLLADFTKEVHSNKRKRVIDIGCGSGLITVLLAWNDPVIMVDGLEILARPAVLAAENAVLNGLESRVSIITDDLRRHRDIFRAGIYDVAVSNPPYYSEGSGGLQENEMLAAAKSEVFCTFDDVCKAAGYLVRSGGAFTVVRKPESLVADFRALNKNGFQPKRIRFVQHSAAFPPCLVLIESRRGGKPSLKIEAPLILTGNDGADSEEIKAIYRLNKQ